MPTSRNKKRQAEPELEETLDPEDLLQHFEEQACTFKTFNTLQSMFNDHVAEGRLQGYTDEALQDFMHHVILISEVIYKLETVAANRLINKLKAGRPSPSQRKEELLRQAEQFIKAGTKRKAS